MKRFFLSSLLLAIFFVSANGISHAADASASSSAKDAVINDKLDKIMATQKDILARLDEVKEELYVVKVRATKR